MADSVDRVFGHALNTVNKIRPGSQKPPSGDRVALYGLYKQAMEGDVADISSRPASTVDGTASDNVRKEQEKWDAWKANEGLTRTEAKRRYIEKLIDTMHKYASTTTEAKELVEELEFVWDQIKNNSQHSSSERSSPLQHIERSGYLNNGGSNAAIQSSAAAMEGAGKKQGELTVLSPMSQTEEDALMDEEREEFVDAPVSQVDGAELQDVSEAGTGVEHEDAGVQASVGPIAPQPDKRWKRKIESSLSKLTNEIAALREQLESTRYFKQQRRRSWFGWVLRLTWWAVQLIVADAFLLWVVILYLRRKQDRRLEGAVRVLLGDAVAQVQKVTGREETWLTVHSAELVWRGRQKAQLARQQILLTTTSSGPMELHLEMGSNVAAKEIKKDTPVLQRGLLPAITHLDSLEIRLDLRGSSMSQTLAHSKHLALQLRRGLTVRHAVIVIESSCLQIALDQIPKRGRAKANLMRVAVQERVLLFEFWRSCLARAARFEHAEVRFTLGSNTAISMEKKRGRKWQLGAIDQSHFKYVYMECYSRLMLAAMKIFEPRLSKRPQRKR